MSNFKPGDKVTLKSGGPSMTVNNISGVNNDIVNCMWFTQTAGNAGELKEANFRMPALMEG